MRSANVSIAIFVGTSIKPVRIILAPLLRISSVATVRMPLSLGRIRSRKAKVKEKRIPRRLKIRGIAVPVLLRMKTKKSSSRKGKTMKKTSSVATTS